MWLVGQVGYNKAKIHAANIYEAKEDEQIESAGFYALGKNTSYQLYMVTDYRNTASLASRVEVARGELEDAGDYTIPFDRPYSVKEGDKFAIVVVLSTPGMDHPMAIEYPADALSQHAIFRMARATSVTTGWIGKVLRRPPAAIFVSKPMERKWKKTRRWER